MAVKRLVDIAAATEAGVGVRRLKRVEDVELKVLEVEAHGSTDFHTHPHAHEGVVVAGTGALRFTDASQALTVGDVFSVDPYDPHAIENHGGDQLRLICMDCFIE